MTRATLIITAIILALGAAALVVWTELGTTLFGPQTLEDRLVSEMNSVASQGGLAASFSEEDARRWKLADGHRFERLSLTSSQAVVGRLASSIPLSVSPPSWESQGLSLELPAAFAQQNNGKRIEIGLIARASRVNPSNVMKAVFATRQAGNSGWRGFELGPEFQVHRILFDMPAVDEGYNASPVVVLHADAEGNGRMVELLGVYVKQVARAP